MTAKTIATAAGIAPRTKRFVFADEYGISYSGGRTELVLAFLGRTDRATDLEYRTRMVVWGIYKSLTTARMNVNLARRLREMTPYQVCAFVARVELMWDGDISEGYGRLADLWLNENADRL